MQRRSPRRPHPSVLLDESPAVRRESASRRAGRIPRLAVVVLALSAPPTSSAALQIDLDLAGRYFAEAEAIDRRDGARLWGVALHGRMMFVDPETRALVANAADPDGRLEPRGGLWVGTYDADRGVANTAVDWSGARWTMLRWPLPEDPGARGALLAHEMFHRVQPELGLSGRDGGAGHLERSEARVLLRLEWRALQRALIEAGEVRRDAVADALAFRARRHAIYPEGAAAERSLEMNEGLAEYTGVVAGGRTWPPPAYAAALALDDADARSARGPVTRTFAYASGPAYGLLLDEAGAVWRRGLTPDSDLGALLAAAYDVAAPADLASAVAVRGERYASGALVAFEVRQEEVRAATAARLRARFAAGPQLVLPVGEAFSYTFGPQGVFALEGLGTVYVPAGSPVVVTDTWGSLEVTAGGVLMERRDGRIVAVKVPAPADSTLRPLAGDGWSLSLADGWTLQPHAAGGWRVVPRE